MLAAKLSYWFDDVDPYGIHRMIVHKALVISTVMVFVYWFFRPNNFIAYILPIFSVSLYEMPNLSSFKQKEQALLLAFFVMMICGLSFYLLFPFRLWFLFYSVVFFTVLYFLIANHFPSLRFLVLITISSSAVFVTVKPQGTLQMAYDIFFSFLLSMLTLYLCLYYLSASYFNNWLLAQQKFIESLELNIESTMGRHEVSFFVDEVMHINMVYLYRRLIQKKYIRLVYKLSYNLRNIQFALSNSYYESPNQLFWDAIKEHLGLLRAHMKKMEACPDPEFIGPIKTKSQKLTLRYLQIAVIQWNKLCSIL